MPNLGLKAGLALVAVLAIVPFATAQNITKNQPTRWQGEPAPVFRVQEVLSEEIIQGPDYVIAQDVPVREYKYLFTIRTAYGEIHALGRNMLEQRLRELYAIEHARKLVRDPQLINGVVETLKQTPKGVKVVLTDPGGTILRAPRGLQRMASNLLDPRNYRAGGEERREFAVQMGCDPETTNPVLIALLDNLAIRKSIGKTGSNVGMNAVLPGLGLLSTTQTFKNQLVKKSPAEINGAIERELLTMGVWEPVARQFCRERSYTTLQRMIFMDHLRAMKQVENVQYLAYRATTAYNEAEGLGVIREMELLRRLHERDGINRIDIQGLPVAMLRDNSVVIVNAADYIHDTQELRDAIAAFRHARPNDPGIFVTAGRISPRAKEMLSDFDLQVIESGQTTLIERVSRQPSGR